MEEQERLLKDIRDEYSTLYPDGSMYLLLKMEQETGSRMCDGSSNVEIMCKNLDYLVSLIKTYPKYWENDELVGMKEKSLKTRNAYLHYDGVNPLTVANFKN